MQPTTVKVFAFGRQFTVEICTPAELLQAAVLDELRAVRGAVQQTNGLLERLIAERADWVTEET